MYDPDMDWVIPEYDLGDEIDRAMDAKAEQDMLADEAREYMVEQRDMDGKWWPGGGARYKTIEAAHKASISLDCPYRVVVA